MHHTKLLLTIALGSLAACYGRPVEQPQNWAGLRGRAALDLQCDASVLHTFPVPEARTATVRGCGQQATYLWHCQIIPTKYGSYEDNCAWLLNGGPMPINGASSNALTAR